MIGHVQHYAAFTFVLSLTLTLNHAQGEKTCSLFSRPHPNGLCGSKLALAHENLCFLIRQNYPQFFSLSKRSMDLEAGDLDDLPVSLLTDLDDQDSEPGSGQEKGQDNSSLMTAAGKDLYPTKLPDLPENIAERETSSRFLHLLTKRSFRTKRSLVCDCCYGPCSARTLARYC